MTASRVWLGFSRRGTDLSSASVYGIRTSENSVAVGACSTICPAYITAMSCVRPATTPRSWLTRTIAMSARAAAPRAGRGSGPARSRRAPWSARRRTPARGRTHRAMAMTTRWRMPPDSSCGYCRRRRSGSGIPTDRSRVTAVSRGGAVEVGVDLERLGDLLADAHHGVERRHGVLEDHRHLRAPVRPQRGVVEAVDALAVERHLARAHGGGGSRPMIERDSTDLPHPDSPTRPSVRRARA